MAENQFPDPGAGLPPADARFQTTWAVMNDIAFYAVSTVLTDYILFSNSVQKPEQYRLATFTDVGQQNNTELYSLRVSHNIQFTQISSQTVTFTQWYFENFSRIKISILKKEYDDIPLALALPYDVCQLGATPQLNARQVPFFEFPDPIVVPPGGNVRVKFIPATGLTTIATAATLPTLPGLGLTSDIGLSIVFQFMGLVKRSMA